MACSEARGTRSKEHGGGHARGAGFSERSGRVLSTCESGFGEEDLGSGESLEDVHGALAERTPPGSRLVQGRCLGCWWRRVEQKTAEWQHFFSAVVGPPAEILSEHPKAAIREHLKSGHTFRRNVQDIDSSGRVSSLSQHGECLEGRKETANHSLGTTGMVSAEDPRGHASTSRDYQRLPERRGCGNMAAGKMATRK
jgi:hypothetical protein